MASRGERGWLDGILSESHAGLDGAERGMVVVDSQTYQHNFRLAHSMFTQLFGTNPPHDRLVDLGRESSSVVVHDPLGKRNGDLTWKVAPARSERGGPARASAKKRPAAVQLAGPDPLRYATAGGRRGAPRPGCSGSHGRQSLSVLRIARVAGERFMVKKCRPGTPCASRSAHCIVA